MNYTDEQQARVNNVYNQREKALAENKNVYSGLIDEAGQLRDSQNQFLAQQTAIQNETLDKQLANQTAKIETQKNEARNLTKKEETKAYNDYLMSINPYGYQNAILNSQGLGQSNASEYQRKSSFVTYNNRVAQANASLTNALTKYDQDINDAITNNDVQKAQNALNELAKRLANTENYYNTKASLTQSQLQNTRSINAQYDDQYNRVYNQILNEQQEAEAIRQWNERIAEERRQYDSKMAYQRERDAIADAQWQQQYNLSLKQLELQKKSINNKTKEYTLPKNETPKISGDQMLYTNFTPDLTSERAQKWYNESIDGKQLTYNQLKGLIQDGLQGIVYGKKTGQGFISEEDAERILRTYGAK